LLQAISAKAAIEAARTTFNFMYGYPKNYLVVSEAKQTFVTRFAPRRGILSSPQYI
jgi:hypothetical protein